MIDTRRTGGSLHVPAGLSLIYTEVFKSGRRKDADGTVIEWMENKAEPRLKRYVPSYLFIEDIVMAQVLPQKLSRASVTPIPKSN